MNNENNENKENLNTVPEVISEENLDKVTGGGYFDEHIVDSPDQVRFIFDRGDEVYVSNGLYFFTQRCRIVRCEIFDFSCVHRHGYSDIYVVESLDYKPGDFHYMYTRVGRQDIKSADF